MNSDDFVGDILSGLQSGENEIDVFLDWMRICRLYEEEFTHKFNAEAFKRNDHFIDWFTRQNVAISVEHAVAERQHMERMKATWMAICAILDATTDDELIAADAMLQAANEMPAPEWHSPNGYVHHVPANTALGDFIRAGFSSSHPAVDTPQYQRFVKIFWAVNDG